MLIDFDSFFENFFDVFRQSYSDILHKSLFEVIMAIGLSENSNKELFYLRFIFFDVRIRNKERLSDNFYMNRSIFFRLLYVLDQIANKINLGLVCFFKSFMLLLEKRPKYIDNI